MKETPPFPEPQELITVLIDLCQLHPRDGHFKAVQLVCSAALEYYRGILALIQNENALAAKVLSRTLLETLITAVLLAKYPTKLEDFQDHGRYTHLRVLKFYTWEIDPQLVSRRDSTLAKHDSDYSSLDEKFRNRAWHGFKRRAAFIEAGFDFDVYDIFYRPVSEMAHGEPYSYIMRNEDDEWILGRSDIKEARLIAGAYMSSSTLLITALRQINRLLGLPFKERIEASATLFFQFAPAYKELLLNMRKETSASKAEPTSDSPLSSS